MEEKIGIAHRSKENAGLAPVVTLCHLQENKVPTEFVKK